MFYKDDNVLFTLQKSLLLTTHTIVNHELLEAIENYAQYI